MGLLGLLGFRLGLTLFLGGWLRGEESDAPSRVDGNGGCFGVIVYMVGTSQAKLF